jgi:hypothetical protein
MKKTIDNNPQLIAGQIINIRGVRNDSGFYPAESVSYDIAARIAGTPNLVTYPMQRPQIRLWYGDIEIDADKLRGCGVVGVMVSRKIHWHFVEPPALGGCGSTSTLPGGTTLVEPIGGVPPLPTGPATGDTGAGGGSITPAPGGGEI